MRISETELKTKLREMIRNGKTCDNMVKIIYQWVKDNRLSPMQMQEACEMVFKTFRY